MHTFIQLLFAYVHTTSVYMVYHTSCTSSTQHSQHYMTRKRRPPYAYANNTTNTTTTTTNNNNNNNNNNTATTTNNNNNTYKAAWNTRFILERVSDAQGSLLGSAAHMAFLFVSMTMHLGAGRGWDRSAPRACGRLARTR